MCQRDHGYLEPRTRSDTAILNEEQVSLAWQQIETFAYGQSFIELLSHSDFNNKQKSGLPTQYWRADSISAVAGC